MVLRPGQILSILEQKREAFSSFDRKATEKRDLYNQAMKKLCQWSGLQMAERLASVSFPGALPTAEWDRVQGWHIDFPHQWESHEQSHFWVKQTIPGTSTFAVDGSQIYPSKDISIPVALVQIGWYENHHSSTGDYEKDIRVDVLTPNDLGANTSGEPKERIVNMRRFQMEVERLEEYLLERRDHPSCLAFLDGALVATFAEPLDPELQEFYVNCLVRLLRTGEKTQVPLVAYIDTTYTRDLVNMVQTIFELPDAPQLHDAQLLSPYLSWGDRTPFFLCARSGTQTGQRSILNRYQEMRERIGFVYLKTNHDRYPARLEIPVWIYEAGLLDRVLDIVRCEVIIGGGYPYVIETADQTALLRSDDRNTFLRILQDWADRETLSLRLSRKTVSKMQRRRIR